MSLAMEKRARMRAPVTASSAFHSSLSPPLWKDQLRQRCLQRLKQDRHSLLAKLRSPDGSAHVAAEMKRLVHSEERRRGAAAGADVQHARRLRRNRARHAVFALQGEAEARRDDEDVEEEEHDALESVDDLMVMGKLSESEYMEIVHSLEDALREEARTGSADGVGVTEKTAFVADSTVAVREGNDVSRQHALPAVVASAEEEERRAAEQMMEFEEASLAAMLAGMDLDGVVEFGDDDDHLPDTMDEADSGGGGGGSGGLHVMCPICKAGCLRETVVDNFQGDGGATIGCPCGFMFHVTDIFHGVLEDFQEKIADAFMAHRMECSADPTFAKIADIDDRLVLRDSLLLHCSTCGHDSLVQ